MSNIDCAACGSPNPSAGRYCVYCSKPLRCGSLPATRHAYVPKLLVAAAGGAAGIAILAIAIAILAPELERSDDSSPPATAATATTQPVAGAAPVEELRYSFTASNGKPVSATVIPTKDGRNAISFSPVLDKTQGNVHSASLQALLNLYHKDNDSLASKEPQIERGGVAAEALYWNVDEWRRRFYSLPIADPRTGRLVSIVVWLDDSHAADDEAVFRTRINANEESAIEYLHSISIAEIRHSESGAPEKYGTLGKLAEGGHLEVRRPLQGYRVDLKVKSDSFEAIALPIKYGVTGRRSFYLSSRDFTVRGRDRSGLEATGRDPSVE